VEVELMGDVIVAEPLRVGVGCGVTDVVRTVWVLVPITESDAEVVFGKE
jgi:hypothetical protein